MSKPATLDGVRCLLQPLVGGQVGPACPGCGKLTVVTSVEIEDGAVHHVQVCALCGRVKCLRTPTGSGETIEVPMLLLLAIQSPFPS